MVASVEYRRGRFVWTAALVCAVSACREPQLGLGPGPTATAVASSSAPPSGPALVVPAAGSERASWLEAALDDALCPEVDDCPSQPQLGERAEIVAVGSRAALVQLGTALYAHHLERGLIGPFAEPPAFSDSAPPAAFGLGDDDALYLATADGQLYRADLDAAAAGFATAGRVAAAELWDFVPGLVVAAAGDTAWISTDGGKSFRASRPEKGAELVGLVARPDGVVVATTEAHSWVSRDRGKRWKLSLLEGSLPHRSGSFIAMCGFVLASDGQHWVEMPDANWHENLWTAVVPLDARAHGLAMPTMHTLLEPPAPPPPAQGDGQTGGIGCTDGIEFDHNQGASGVMGGQAGEFSPFGLSHFIDAPYGPAPLATRSHFAFAGDGLCAAKDAGGEADGYACEEGALFTRPPHLAVIDRPTLATKLLSVPASCSPRQVYDAMGAGLVVCSAASSRLGLALVDPQGQVAVEAGIDGLGTLDDGLAQASDGTLLVATRGSGEHERPVAVRLPLPFGAASVWRSVTVPGAIGYRVQPGGAVLAVVAPGPSAERFDLVLDRPGAPAARIAADIPVEGGLEAVSLGDDGLVHVERRAMQGGLLSHVVDTTGHLGPAPPSD